MIKYISPTGKPSRNLIQMSEKIEGDSEHVAQVFSYARIDNSLLLTIIQVYDQVMHLMLLSGLCRSGVSGLIPWYEILLIVDPEN